MAVRKKKRTTTRKKKKSTRSSGGPYYTWALYADSGVGKTTLSASAPSPFFLDSNQGLLSVIGRPGFEHITRSSRTTVGNWRHLERAYANFTKTGRKDWSKYNTVVFDHFDDIQGLILDDLTEQAHDKDPRRPIDETQQREWGIMLNRVRRLMRKYKALPMHKILILSAKENSITGRLEPALQGAFARQLPYFCDMIGYMYIRKGKRMLSFRETSERYIGKCRPWWWTEKDKLITIPDIDSDPKFLSHLFQSIAAGPGKSTQRGNTQEG